MKHHRSLTGLAAARTALAVASVLFATPNARAQYSLMRGNIHAHTAFSDGGSLDFSTTSPQSAAVAAMATGLSVFATSDHGEYLSEARWETTKTQARDATQPSQGFVALWGFEWTASKDSVPTEASGLGHLNVYGSPRRAGMGPNPGVPEGTPTDWVRRIWWTNPAAANPTAGSLYQWILDNGVSPLDGGTVVAQFNHPSSMPGVSLANPSSRVVEGDRVVVTDWWRKMEWVEPLDPYMALMELSGRTPRAGSVMPLAQSMAWNEPYYQLALDNGWHVSPTNGEDNHRDSYGYDVAITNEGAQVFVSTGIWAEGLTGLPDTPAGRTAAQAKVLAALRARRTFATEYKTGLLPGAHNDGTWMKMTVNTISNGVKWMGDRTLGARDVQGARCRLEVKSGKGLTLDRVEVVTNRGRVARTLPVSGPGVTIAGGVASWEFGLAGETPRAQIRVSSDTFYATNAYANPPLTPTWHGASRRVVLDASPSGRVERYYYARAVHVDSAGKPYWTIGAPIWIQRPRRTPVSYRWEFGDGTTPVTVSVPVQPAPDTVYSEVKHTYSAAGSVFHPRVTVTYSDGSAESAITRVVFGTEPTAPLYGDVNGDGQINGEDVAALSRYVSGLEAVPDAAWFARANVHPAANGGSPGGSTHLDMGDLLRLARFLGGALHNGSQIPAWP